MLSILRIFLLGLSFFIFTPPALLLSIVRPFNPNNIYFFACLWGPVAQKILGFDVRLTNHQIMKDNRPCVFIMNHQSNYDIVLGGIIKVKRTVSLGKKEILWFPIFGLFYWLSGNILIKREKKRKALAAMKKVNRIIKEKNISILIMPEGTRSKGKGLGSFKKGAFRTAVGAEVPIVPICVSSWSKSINLNKWNSGLLYINVLEPIKTNNMTSKDVEKLTVLARDRMFHEIERLDGLL
tara:strand:- start:60 stop:773 length:714 start_codon:yes stop_codon:yes gene_type:complete